MKYIIAHWRTAWGVSAGLNSTLDMFNNCMLYSVTSCTGMERSLPNQIHTSLICLLFCYMRLISFRAPLLFCTYFSLQLLNSVVLDDYNNPLNLMYFPNTYY